MRRAAIERLLPAAYQQSAASGPLAAILDGMERLHEPDEAALARIHDYFQPYVAPPRFVPYLAAWVDLDWLLGELDAGPEPRFTPGLGRLRNLIAISSVLSARRGTASGLVRFLETATGVRGFAVLDLDGSGVPFHVVVEAPVEARPWRDVVEGIVERMRPAHATYEVRFPGDGDPAVERAADEDEPAADGSGELTVEATEDVT